MNEYDDGIYAPSIRKNNGTYYVYYNAYTTGFYYSTATNIAGPWKTQPLLDKNGKALLTGAAWDDPVSCSFPTSIEYTDNFN
jgi:beta-xylosidase